MRRRPWLRVVVGLVLLALAAGALVLARGTSEAASAFRHGQAEWQGGLAPAPPAQPGAIQRTGEALLGIRTRADVMRAYAKYRAGMADVIPGTTYPQTRARFEAEKTLEELRTSLAGGADRASVDTVLGVVLAGGAASAGQRRDAELARALDVFRRAVGEDPANDSAKLDLELQLRATAPRQKASARISGSATKKRQANQTPRSPTAPAQAEGTGF
jgi:hypothetical protein